LNIPGFLCDQCGAVVSFADDAASVYEGPAQKAWNARRLEAALEKKVRHLEKAMENGVTEHLALAESLAEARARAIQWLRPEAEPEEGRPIIVMDESHLKYHIINQLGTVPQQMIIGHLRAVHCRAWGYLPEPGLEIKGGENERGC
jgi:hypothetical protein